MLKVSLNELIMLMFFLVIGVMIFVSCVYYVEGGFESDGFQSILYVFWWVVVIMIIVGYGDVFFVSLLGKIVGVLCVILGKLI